jgi:formate dehydrogenase maturation protein FdhE
VETRRLAPLQSCYLAAQHTACWSLTARRKRCCSTSGTLAYRITVGDMCHTYLKSIDLTKSGLAIPVVDELATIPLDLWAPENGYLKLQIKLLGTWTRRCS